MSLPNAKITNPSLKERLGIGLWSARSGLEGTRVASTRIAIVLSICAIVATPAYVFWEGKIGVAISLTFFGLLALIFLAGLWRSKRSIGEKLVNSVLLCVPYYGVILFHILNAAVWHISSKKDENAPSRLSYPGWSK